MLNLQSAKRPHTLHTSDDAATFLARFATEADQSMDDVVRDYALPGGVAAVVLGGSIPMGIATPASDVDLLVVIDAADVLRLAPECGTSEPQTTGASIGEVNRLKSAETVVFVNGIEVNLVFVTLPELSAISRVIAGPRVWISFTGENTAILARIKTGWVLSSSDRFRSSCAALLSTNALEIHGAVRYFVFALQDLEDAMAALNDNLPVALHLGRNCVEQCFFAYMATDGHVYPGSKWLRCLNGDNPRSRINQTRLGPLASAGLSLMFPALLDERVTVADYLREVAVFADGIRGVIEQSTAFRMAFKLCPQIHPALDLYR